MLSNILIILMISVQLGSCYSNKQFTIMKPDTVSGFECDGQNSGSLNELKRKLINIKDWQYTKLSPLLVTKNYTFATMRPTISTSKDPIFNFEAVIRQILFGNKPGDGKVKLKQEIKPPGIGAGVDVLAHLPSGGEMRTEIFHNKSSVHLPFSQFLHRGHVYLKITRDHMQTALDAFSILLSGNLEDVMRLPPAYVLRSARTIAMMRIAREKLATTWFVVKGSVPTDQISHETLEQFRPLFKYINGKEMSRLNLLDNRILSFIGTHPDLNRHQVGVVASRYIQLNPHWTQARYLNLMNNLLCGVPMIFMRRIPEETYLQLTHQLFYHIWACDPLQRRFYLQMMTRTQALGKSYSWSARDVSRLGLLLTEIDGGSLSEINPEAMSGITSQVMLQMPTQVLLRVTDMQLTHIEPKSLNILAKKINAYYSQRDEGKSGDVAIYCSRIILLFIFLRQMYIEMSI